jgi:hypothetical protein
MIWTLTIISVLFVRTIGAIRVVSEGRSPLTVIVSAGFPGGAGSFCLQNIPYTKE